MTIEQLWKILKKQWKFILLCFLLGGIGTFGGSKLMKPVYQSTTLIRVSVSSGTSQASYDNLLASEELVATEADLATSTPVLSEVASHYPGLTVSVLVTEVSATPKANTQLFGIAVTDPSPTQAATLANDIAGTLIKQQLQAIGQQNSQAQQNLQLNIDQTAKQINQTTAQISALQASKTDQTQISLLQAKLTGLQQQYSQWQSALAQLELSQAQSGKIMQITQPAEPTSKPVRPNIPLNTGGGLLVGLFLGVLLALLIEQLDTHVRTPEELTQLLAWPTLATIWRHDSAKMENLIGPTGHEPNAEAYRILRTNIGFLGVDKPVRSIIVTSALPGEGKSTIAANLAIFMARAGKNTLLIDVDLRRPMQHTLFNLPQERAGLSNAVLALGRPKPPQSPFPQIMKMPPQNGITPYTLLEQQYGDIDPHTFLEPFVCGVGIPNLWVMPSGPLPPNPSEFLESQSTKRLLAVAADCGVEMLIIDAPPLTGVKV